MLISMVSDLSIVKGRLMLEVRYNETTKELTGWWGDRHGNHEVKLKNRPSEKMAMLDIDIPEKDLSALLFDGTKLIPNPAHVEPPPPRDLLAEIDELKARLDKITKVNGVA